MRTFLRILSVVLLVCWMAVIFMFSSQTADVSSDTSGRIVKLVIEELYPDYENLSEAEQQTAFENCQYIVRKTAHLCAYSLLGFFAFLTFISYTKMRFFTRMFWATAVCVLYAASDEYHQRFVQGRSGELRDLLIDTAGVLVAIVFLTVFVKIIPPLRRKTNYNPVKKVKEPVLQNENIVGATEVEEVPKAEEISQVEEITPVEESDFAEEIFPKISDEVLPNSFMDFGESIQRDFDAAAEEFMRGLEELADKFGLKSFEPYEQTTEESLNPVESLEDNLEFSQELLEELFGEEFIPEEIDEEVKQEVEEIAEEIGEEFEEEIEEPVEIEPISVIESIINKPKSQVALSEEMQYGASVIGKAVIEVTKLCNALSTDEQDLTRKELINLALGRNEIFKSKVLEILGSEISFEQKKIFIEDERKDTYDYFNSIIAQIS